MKTAQTTVLLSVVPQLPSLSLSQDIEFYKNILGFQLMKAYPGFAILKREQLELHLWHCDNKLIPENSSCYLRVENIDALYTEIKTTDVTMRSPLQLQQWGCREFIIADPSGNLIRIGELKN
ncbi:MAG TPA: VOC family protein [Candidatus Obscuribacterales bacterium]